MSEPDQQGDMRGVVEFIEEFAVIPEQPPDESRNGENNVPMGHGLTDGVGNECSFFERAALVATRAEAALLAGERQQELMPAVGAMHPGEAGVKVAASEERFNCAGNFGVKRRKNSFVVVKELPDR